MSLENTHLPLSSWPLRHSEAPASSSQPPFLPGLHPIGLHHPSSRPHQASSSLPAGWAAPFEACSHGVGGPHPPHERIAEPRQPAQGRREREEEAESEHCPQLGAGEPAEVGDGSEHSCLLYFFLLWHFKGGGDTMAASSTQKSGPDNRWTLAFHYCACVVAQN